MPRDTAGNYTLPAGNPVASGEIISASWANSTMNDLGQSLSASLDRYGRGGMLAPFQFTDGTESAPGATWSNEPTTGLYRAAYGDLRFTLTGTDVQRWTSANSYLWRNSQWEEILTQTGGGGDTTINNLVVTGSFTSPGIDDNATSTAITIDANENVGIGDTNPSESLSVDGNITVESAIYRTTVGSGGIRFASSGSMRPVNTAGASTDLALDIGDPSFRFNDLHLGGDALIDGNVGYTGKLFSSNDTATLGGLQLYRNHSSGDCYLFDTTPVPFSGDMIFGTTNTERMRITAAGVTQVTGGFEAAQSGAGANAFAAGLNAGLTGQAAGAIAVGASAGETSQSQFGVAVGNAAGYTSQGASAIAVGNSAGQTTQATGAVAVGFESGLTTQGESAVAVGRNSGQTSQGANSVAVGRDAGFTGQGALATAVGYYAGKEAQGTGAVAVGREAGQTRQGETAIALGYASGYADQGVDSIAIGNRAGQSNQAANGIIINSSGVAKNVTDANHIYLTSGTAKYLYYNGTNTWEFRGGNVTVPNDNLLVGVTTSIGGSSEGIELRGDAGYFKTARNTSATAGHWEIYNSLGLVGSVTTASNATFFNSLSDERAKENIVDAPAGNIDSIKVRSFDWKSDGSHQEYGFIAQELETVAPYAVSKGEADEDMMSVDYSKLVPMLVKEIQDLKAEVAALKA